MEEVNEAFFYPEASKIGGSLGFTVPKDVVELISLNEGDKLKVQITIVKRKGEYSGK